MFSWFFNLLLPYERSPLTLHLANYIRTSVKLLLKMQQQNSKTPGTQTFKSFSRKLVHTIDKLVISILPKPFRELKMRGRFPAFAINSNKPWQQKWRMPGSSQRALDHQGWCQGHSQGHACPAGTNTGPKRCFPWATHRLTALDLSHHEPVFCSHWNSELFLIIFLAQNSFVKI